MLKFYENYILIFIFFVLLISQQVNGADIGKCSEAIKVIERISPRYPTDVMERKKIEFVRMSFSINLSGKVSDVRILELSNREFGRTAVRTIKKWLFESPKTACRHEVTLKWQLE
jgi:TonB family protein